MRIRSCALCRSYMPSSYVSPHTGRDIPTAVCGNRSSPQYGKRTGKADRCIAFERTVADGSGGLLDTTSRQSQYKYMMM